MSPRTPTRLATCLLALCAAGGAWSADAAPAGQPDPAAAGKTERKLAEADVPAAVLATMRKAAAGAKLGEFESEKKAGAEVYTAEFTRADGGKMEVTVAPDGTLRGVEEDEEDVHADAKAAAPAAKPEAAPAAK